MGCGASFDKECKPEQKTTLCAVMGKEMMLLCVEPALAKCDQIKVPAPPEIARLREDVARFRQEAKDAKQSITEAGSAGPKAEEKEGEKQSMLGGMLSMGQSVVEKAAGTIAGGVAAGAEAALNTVADQLEKVVNGVEEPFVKVGKDIVEAKKDKINDVFKYFIANLPLASSGMAVKLVRGEDPTGPDEYDKVPPDALTDYLCRKSAKNLVAQLLPVCEEAIKEHTVTKRWDQVIENYNGLSAKIAAIDFAKKNNLTLKPIELDIKDYIVSQCVEQIALLMAQEEAEIRKAPAQSKRTKTPKTFDTVFSGSMITDKLFNQYSNGKDI